MYTKRVVSHYFCLTVDSKTQKLKNNHFLIFRGSVGWEFEQNILEMAYPPLHHSGASVGKTCRLRKGFNSWGLEPSEGSLVSYVADAGLGWPKDQDC